jgi:ABC-type sugar transport system permease subunit
MSSRAGGPDEATTFLSHALVQTALIQFDLGAGAGAAMTVLCLLIVLAVSWAFFRLLVPPVSAR